MSLISVQICPPHPLALLLLLRMVPQELQERPRYLRIRHGVSRRLLRAEGWTVAVTVPPICGAAATREDVCGGWTRLLSVSPASAGKKRDESSRSHESFMAAAAGKRCTNHSGRRHKRRSSGSFLFPTAVIRCSSRRVFNNNGRISHISLLVPPPALSNELEQRNKSVARC